MTAALAATTLASARSEACLPDAGLGAGQPAMNSTDVPTDVVPWVQGQFANTGTFQLEDATGTVVPTDVRGLVGDAFNSFAEVHPRVVLAPRTRYLVRGSLADPSWVMTMIAFTTGDGPLADAAPIAPHVQMQFGVSGGTPSCGNQVALCIATDVAGTFETTVRRSDGTIAVQVIGDGGLTGTREPLWGGSALASGTFCAEVRRRDLAGRLSPPATVCSDAVPHFAVEYGVGCDGARMVDSAGYLDERAGSDGGSSGGDAASESDASPADSGTADSGTSGGRGGCSVASFRPVSDRHPRLTAFAIVAALGAVARSSRRKRYRP